MRHRKSGRKLGMDSTERKAMFKNMATSLLLHGKIRTTEARAKELRRFAERLITIGKGAPSPAAIDGLQGDERQRAEASRLYAYRRAAIWVNDQVALKRLFDEYAERFRARAGGYTRVVKAGRREGDNARMAVIELVGDLDDKVAAPRKPVSDTAVKEVEDAKAEAEAEVEAIKEEAAEEEDAASTEVGAPTRSKKGSKKPEED